MSKRRRARWVQRHDRNWHESQHVRHALLNVRDIVVGVCFIIFLILCVCGQVWEGFTS